MVTGWRIIMMRQMGLNKGNNMQLNVSDILILMITAAGTILLLVISFCLVHSELSTAKISTDNNAHNVQVFRTESV